MMCPFIKRILLIIINLMIFLLNLIPFVQASIYIFQYIIISQKCSQNELSYRIFFVLISYLVFEKIQLKIFVAIILIHTVFLLIVLLS